MKPLKNARTWLQDDYNRLRSAYAGKSTAGKILLTARLTFTPALYAAQKAAILVLPSNLDRSLPRLRDEFSRASVPGKVWLGTKLTMKGVGIWLWPPAARFERPFSRIGMVKKLKRGIKTLAAITGVVFLHNIVQVGTAQLFPTGEKFLSSQGVDPKFAKDLSDHRIRVRSRDFWGKLHATFDIPTIFGVIQSLGMQSQSVQAWAIPGMGQRDKGEIHNNFRNDCMVMLPPPDMTAKSAIEAFTGIPKEMIEHLPASDREVVLAATFHEFAHCDTQNTQSDFEEEDADLRGVSKAAEATGNKELPVIVLHARAMSTHAGDHDTAAYLEAARKHEKLPTRFSEAANDSKTLFILADLYKKRMHGVNANQSPSDILTHGESAPPDKRPDFILEVEAIRYVLKHHSDLLSPASIRRGEMYIEAAEYFAPKATALAVPPQDLPRQMIR